VVSNGRLPINNFVPRGGLLRFGLREELLPRFGLRDVLLARLGLREELLLGDLTSLGDLFGLAERESLFGLRDLCFGDGERLAELSRFGDLRLGLGE